MIIVGTTKPKLINPKQIIQLELKQGRITAFVKGAVDNDGDIKVKDLTVREPWTVVIRTAIGREYVNADSFESALSSLLGLARWIDPSEPVDIIEKEMRKIYGKQETSK